jgi:hypothetical protein
VRSLLTPARQHSPLPLHLLNTEGRKRARIEKVWWRIVIWT